MNDLTKNILLWVVIVFVLLLVFSRYMPSVSQQEEIKYSTFLNDVKARQVDSVVFQGDMLYGVMKDHTRFKTNNPETDYTALIGALERGLIAGAALDVFEREPLIPDGLRRDNVVLAPHLGSASVETRTRMALIAVENAIAFFAGKRPPTILNPEALRQI